jgi:hypothetical protein
VTITYDELGYAYDMINWSYDGAELNTSSNPIFPLAATGTLATSFAAPPGSLLTYTATGVIEDGD